MLFKIFNYPLFYFRILQDHIFITVFFLGGGGGIVSYVYISIASVFVKELGFHVSHCVNINAFSGLYHWPVVAMQFVYSV